MLVNALFWLVDLFNDSLFLFVELGLREGLRDEVSLIFFVSLDIGEQLSGGQLRLFDPPEELVHSLFLAHHQVELVLQKRVII